VNKRRSGEIHEGEVESVVFLDTLLEFAQDETMEIKITKEQIKGLVVVSFFSSNLFFSMKHAIITNILLWSHNFRFLDSFNNICI
jgi:hypothetical protein